MGRLSAMSSIFISVISFTSVILSLSAYEWEYRGQETVLKKEDLKVFMYPGFPPESFAHLSKDIRKELGPEKPVLLTAKIAADGNFKAAAQGLLIDGQITRIDGDRIEVIFHNLDLKPTVKLGEPIQPKGFFIGSVYYFRIKKNTEELDIKPAEYRPAGEGRPTLKPRRTP